MISFSEPAYGRHGLLRRQGPVGTVEALVWLERSARDRREVVERRQLERLRTVVDHAARHVPVHAGLRGTELSDLTDLPALPTTSKALYRDSPTEALTSGPIPDSARRHVTSGSTGEPLAVWFDGCAHTYLGALYLRMQRVWGVPLWARRLRLTEAPNDTTGLRALYRGRFRSLAPTLAPEKMAAEVLRLEPHYVAGTPQLLLDLGEELAGRFRPRCLTSFGETLYPGLRQAIASAWGIEPFDGYGLIEVGRVAWQCRATDLYHVNHETVLVEVVDDDGRPTPPGTPGEIVVTGLCNPLMPFIRYRTGDVGTLAERPCACGSELATLASVEGRELDWLVDATGRRVGPARLWLSSLLAPEEMGWVRRFRVRQDRTGSVRVEIVACSPPGEGALAHIERLYRGSLGPDLPIEVVLVDALELGRRGKLRVISSEIGPTAHQPG